MNLIPTQLQECFIVEPFISHDERGTFVKSFHVDRFAALGLPVVWNEEYYSISRKGVIRGMHFQTPPYDHEKLVYCMRGRVLDVVLDLRISSPTYRQHIAIELDDAKKNGLMIPKGMAHGFLALTDDVLMSYKVTTVYAPENDAGIHWNSFGFNWKIEQPIVSARDNTHPAFKDFVSPFEL